MAYALTTSDLKDSLPLIARGKVRDLYELPNNQLLFVATDRISAYDVIMKNGIPGKGKLLTALSVFWFSKLGNICRNHLITTDLRSSEAALPDAALPFVDEHLHGRSMVVGRYEVFKIEAIVRGYITGSAWSEYKKSGTVHGIKIREGMKESEAFDTPIYTPSTKADQGEHAKSIVGEKYAQKIEDLAISLYTQARDYAIQHGIIIADTKFEFGLDKSTDEIVLIDEVLTPDSSRFWPKDAYQVGKSQNSYDKQYLRDWLTENNLKGKDGVEMSENVVNKTKEKYLEAYERLTQSKVDI